MSLLFCAGLAWVMDLIPLSHPGREAEPERGILFHGGGSIRAISMRQMSLAFFPISRFVSLFQRRSILTALRGRERMRNGPGTMYSPRRGRCLGGAWEGMGTPEDCSQTF